jgi:hypothetical protein
MVNQSHKPTSFLRALLLLALILSGVAQSHAKDFSYGGLTYTTLTDNTCETKAGEWDDYSETYSPASPYLSGDLVIPETVYDTIVMEISTLSLESESIPLYTVFG